MPKHMSSLSNEDEADNPATESAVKRKETGQKTTTYQCPTDFVSFCHVPCHNTLTDSLKNNQNELWLIKAPVSFNPEWDSLNSCACPDCRTSFRVICERDKSICLGFSHVKVPLSGLQTLNVPAAAGEARTGSGQQIYSILGSNHGTSELRLLTSDKQSSDGLVFGPTFSGLLNVCETYRDSSTNQAPQVIPAAPAPSIPAGLKQRFHPFGSKTPTLTCVAENEADGAAFGPSSSTLRPLVVKRFIDEEEEEEGRKKKKKKKKKEKENQIKTEREEEVVKVKEEPVGEIQEEGMINPLFQEADDLGEKRKKKKKKKDREREEAEERLEPSERVKVEEVTVKCEPLDTSYSDAAEGSGKKKKKRKKKSKSGDD